jgi:hypothetical protein
LTIDKISAINCLENGSNTNLKGPTRAGMLPSLKAFKAVFRKPGREIEVFEEPN